MMLAATAPSLFSFAPGLDGATVYATVFTVSGTADPETGIIAITAGGECTAAVDEVTGGFGCELPIFQSTPALEIRAQYLNDGEEFEVLGAATVSVILPPELAGVSYVGDSPS